MADPNAKSDKALQDIVSEAKKQTAGLVALNENFVALAKVMIPAFEKINTLLEALVPEEHEDEEIEITEKTEFISVLVEDLSHREVVNAGYVLHDATAGKYIRVPRIRVKEEIPDGS